MIKKIIRFPITLARFVLMIKRSKYNTLSDKINLFFALISIQLKLATGKKSKIVKQNILGFKVYGPSYKEMWWTFQEIFLGNIYYVDCKVTNPKIIDCGANVGMAVIYFKAMYPSCEIIAFEPNPFAFEILNKNIKENNINGVTAYNKALSSVNGTLDLHFGNITMVGSLYPDKVETNKVTVDSVKLSEFITGKKFDIVKIDVEGAENDIIKDLYESNCIANSDRYVIEYHHLAHGQPPRLSQFLEPFEKTGFSYNIIETKYIKTGIRQDVFFSFYKQVVN